MGAKLGEFLIDLVVDAGNGELTLNKLVQSMGELEVATVGQVGILFTLADRLAKVTSGAMGTAEGLRLYTALTGDASESLQRWTAVVKGFGLQGDMAQQTASSLSSSLKQMELGKGLGPLTEMANTLGIEVGKFSSAEPIRLLEAIKNNPIFKGMDPAAQKEFLNFSKIPEAMIIPMTDVSGQFEYLHKNATVFSRMDLHKFTELSDLFGRMNNSASSIGDAIARWSVGPLLISLKYLEEYMADLKKKWSKLTKEDEDKLLYMAMGPFTPEGRGLWSDLLSGPAGLREPKIQWPEHTAPVAARSAAYEQMAPTPLSSTAREATLRHEHFFDILVNGRPGEILEQITKTNGNAEYLLGRSGL